jgi:hypothetical protein
MVACLIASKPCGESMQAFTGDRSVAPLQLRHYHALLSAAYDSGAPRQSSESVARVVIRMCSSWVAVTHVVS